MSVAAFLTHIANGSPVFRCYACGDDSEELTLSARLAHTLEEPATADDLQQLRDWLGSHADQFIQLYSLHNGLTLYEDTVGDAEGVCLYPIEDWQDQTEDMKSQFEEMGLEPDEQPTGVNNALAFAEIPHSGNYFTVKISGPDTGKIYYADHDDFDDEPFAESLADFVARIVADPPQFLYDVGCYTRYSDGKTSTQWIPKEFVANAAT